LLGNPAAVFPSISIVLQSQVLVPDLFMVQLHIPILLVGILGLKKLVVLQSQEPVPDLSMEQVHTPALPVGVSSLKFSVVMQSQALLPDLPMVHEHTPASLFIKLSILPPPLLYPNIVYCSSPCIDSKYQNIANTLSSGTEAILT